MKRVILLLAVGLMGLSPGCARVEYDPFDSTRTDTLPGDTGSETITGTDTTTDSETGSHTQTDTGSETASDTGSEPECQGDTDCGAGRYCDSQSNCSSCGDTDADHCGQDCVQCIGDKPACRGGHCVGICDLDENSDGIYDLVIQPGSYPTLCWRRCPLPQVWNGSECTGSASTYSWSAAKAACEARGYRLPTAQEYMGPSIASGILEGCAAVDLDWLCSSCSGSALCSEMFGQDEGQYWASTVKVYWSVTCHYKADFYTGSLNFHDSSYVFGARCVK